MESNIQKKEINQMPLIIDKDGTKFRLNQNNQLHRLDGPAIEYTNGIKAWFQNDKLHRTDGPAVEYPNGNKEYRINDKLHRTDGPAIEYANGYKAWYLNGINYTEQEYNKINQIYKNQL